MHQSKTTEQSKAANETVRRRRKLPDRRAQEIMQEARALAASKAKSEPISKKELAKQEGLSERDVSRKLKLATLPQEVQVLVEEGKLPVLAAEHLANDRLSQHEQSALAAKIVDGRGNGEARDAVRKMVQVVLTWTPGSRTSFLADPLMTFDEAREQNKEQERQRREQQLAEQRRASERRAGNRKFRWVAVDIIDHFNQTMTIIATGGRVDPMARQSAIDGLRASVGNGLVALAVLADRQTALQALQAAQNRLNQAAQIEPGSAETCVVAGEVVPGHVSC